MIDSRDLALLHPFVQAMARMHYDACLAVGIPLLFTSTLRDDEAQDHLYAQGRTRPGKKVTNAKAGQSMHNHGVAYDVVPLDGKGKPIWDVDAKLPDGRKIWDVVGELGEAQGLEWGGRWKFKDMPHFQYTQGIMWQQFKNGEMIK